ncbi:MAG: hypothetical protein ACM3YO_09110 [Bacteroidota bacterium]
MRRFFNLYQYITPLLLFPLAYWLWFSQSHSHPFALFALSIPIVAAYVIPGIGTNVLGLWEFDTRLRLGKFRPQHGFVFGTATSLFAILCADPSIHGFSLFGWLRAGFILGTVIGFWNWLYDIYAIKVGFIRMYNQPYARGEGAEAIATDYAPAYFGLHGVCYGLVLYLAQYLFLEMGHWKFFWPLLILGHLVTLSVPTLSYMGLSRLQHGHTGLKSFKEAEEADNTEKAKSVG